MSPKLQNASTLAKHACEQNHSFNFNNMNVINNYKNYFKTGIGNTAFQAR